MLDAAADNLLGRVFFEAITPSELACWIGEIKGLDQHLLSDPPADARALIVALSEVRSTCIDPEQDSDILIATFESQAGRLSVETKQCIRDIIFDNSAPEGVPRMYALQRSSFQSSKCFSYQEHLE